MRIKSLTGLLWKVSPNIFFISIIISGLAGLAYALLIPFLLYAIDTEFVRPVGSLDADYNFFNSPISALASLFLVALFSIIFFKTISMILTICVGAEATLRARILVCRKIYSMPTLNMEKIGYPNLINLVNVDVQRVSETATILPAVFVSIITILGVLGYLFYLNTSIFFFVIACLVLAILTYQAPLMMGSKYLNRQRIQFDVMQAGCRGLVLGSKELKLDEAKFQQFFNQEVVTAEEAGKNNYIKGLAFIIFGENYGEVISMLVVAVVIFHLSFVYSLTQVEVFGTVMALLYLTGPVGTVLGAMSGIELGRISLKRLAEFFETAEDENVHSGDPLEPAWNQLELKDIGFSYPKEDEGVEFCVKAVSAVLKRGEITFLVGGNGSGKSTLSRVISTHYQFSEGEMFFDNQSVKELNLLDVRRSISVIYTDFHIFPALYKDYPQDEIVKYIQYLELDGLVEVRDGKFSTIALSDGQRKRLALLTVLLENRPICIFDEWAADQDPHFKEIFYYKVLPELKRKNKLVIVISHDDRYFSVADQVITMENGKVRDLTVTESGRRAECLLSGV